MTDVSISAAGVLEADVICRVIHDCFAEYEGRLVPPSAALAESSVLIAYELTHGTTAWLAWSSGEAVGCVLARPKGSEFYFGRLSVVPSFRGCRVAALLIAAVEEAGRKRGFAAVVCSVRLVRDMKRRLFGQLGYVEIGQTAHPGFNEPTSVDLRKRTALDDKGNPGEG